MLSLSSSKAIAIRTLRAIVPSCSQQTDLTTHKRESSTSHLDGLRGIAAFIVLLSHCAAPWYQELRKGCEPGQRKSILQLPIIRLLYHGSPMVVIFFQISGFVLSLKPLRLARNGTMEECFSAISSAILRRGLRLFLPTLIATLVVAVLVQLNLYNFPYGYNLPDEHFTSPEHLPSLWDQLADWVHFVCYELTNPWSRNAIDSEYDIPLWTIPIEFCSLMRLFLAMFGLCQLRVAPRVCLTVALCIYYTCFGRWLDATVLGGITMAELHLIKLEAGRQLSRPKDHTLHVPEMLAISSFILGLFLYSYPEQIAETTPGYVWLSALDNHYRHWESIDTVFIVWGVDNTSLIKKICNLHLLQYLGKISCSLYIVHFPVLFVAVFPLQIKLWGALVEDSGFFFYWKYHVVSIPGILLALWIADLYWRLIDVPCVTLSHWIVRRLRQHIY
jgi:peptidoglycan/LPS O-acetylase OafA/YrhL